MRWEKHLTHGNKHLFLCDAVSRLPEDVKPVLDELRLKGKKSNQEYQPRILNLLFEH